MKIALTFLHCETGIHLDDCFFGVILALIWTLKQNENSADNAMYTSSVLDGGTPRQCWYEHYQIPPTCKYSIGKPE